MVEVRQIENAFAALGIAAHFMAQRQPFDSFRARDFIDTLDGQVRRRHFLFAFEGRKVTGYVGWVLFDEETSERLMRTGEAPSNELAQSFAASGRVIWILTTASLDKDSNRALMHWLRDRHPGYGVVGVRSYENGRKRYLRLRIPMAPRQQNVVEEA